MILHIPHASVLIPENFRDQILLSDREMGHSLAVDRPYSGTIVPVTFLEDSRLSSIMIEVNRCLYMDEETGQKREDFLSVKRTIRCLLDSLAMSWWGLPIETPFLKSESEAKSLAAALLKEKDG